MARFNASALLLQKINYSETSLIIKCLTARHGVQSYMFSGAKRKGKHGNLLQPLASVELTCYNRPESTLGKVSSAALLHQRKRIPNDSYRSALIMFMTDVLIHLLPEEDPQDDLYDFLLQLISVIDDEQFPPEAHIFFLTGLTNHLGIYPQDVHKNNVRFFDFLNGEFSPAEPPHHVFADPEETIILLKAFKKQLPTEKSFVHGEQRMQAIHLLIRYLGIHFDNFKKPSSLDVLETLFD